MNKKRKQKEKKTSITKERKKLLDIYKEKVPLVISGVALSQRNQSIFHEALSSGIKSYNTYYKEGFFKISMGKGLTFVSNLLLKSGFYQLHDLGEDIKRSGKL